MAVLWTQPIVVDGIAVDATDGVADIVVDPRAPRLLLHCMNMQFIKSRITLLEHGGCAREKACLTWLAGEGTCACEVEGVG